MKPPSEDKSESVTNVLLINYLYLLAELLNERRPTSEGPRVLFRLSNTFLYLILSVQAMIIFLSQWKARRVAAKMMGQHGEGAGASLHASGSNLVSALTKVCPDRQFHSLTGLLRSFTVQPI